MAMDGRSRMSGITELNWRSFTKVEPDRMRNRHRRYNRQLGKQQLCHYVMRQRSEASCWLPLRLVGQGFPLCIGCATKQCGIQRDWWLSSTASQLDLVAVLKINL